MTTTPLDPTGAASLGEFLTLLKNAANVTDEDGNPQPVAKGTFAMYAMPDGGIMFVSNIAEGPMTGTHHHRVPPGMVRMALSLADSGGAVVKLKALKGLLTRGKS